MVSTVVPTKLWKAYLPRSVFSKTLGYLFFFFPFPLPLLSLSLDRALCHRDSVTPSLELVEVSSIEPLIAYLHPPPILDEVAPF